MSDTPKHSVSVAGIVVDDQDRVLVIKRRDNGQWEPPGGVLELEERPDDGAVREVFEETGIVVEVQRLTGVYKNTTRGIVALVFRCRRLSGAAQPTTESLSVDWWTEDIVRQKMTPAFAVRVVDALANPADVVLRAHDGVQLLG